MAVLQYGTTITLSKISEFQNINSSRRYQSLSRVSKDYSSTVIAYAQIAYATMNSLLDINALD